MFYYLIFIGLFTYLFLFFNSGSHVQVPIVQESWAWSKSSEYGLSPDPRTKINPLKSLNGYRIGKSSYIFSKSQTITNIADGELTEFPILGEGYFQYKKIGDKINFFSGDGELLWQKPYSSYPVSTPRGKVSFLISGDGNQVLVIDPNGNQTGIKQADGRFLTDIAHSANFGSVLLFSGGEIYRLDLNGNLIYKKTGLKTKEKTLQFYKSAAISEDGKKIAVHYFSNDQDIITVLDEKGEISKLNIALPHLYPHKIFMALDSNETLLANLPDALFMFGSDGKVIHKSLKKRKEQVHQVAFTKAGLFVGSIQDNLFFLNNNGFPVKTKQISGFPVRVFDSGVSNFFFLESGKEIIGFQKF